MNKDAIEIRIAELAAMLLKAFKHILVVSLIIGLLGAGYGLFHSINAGKNSAALKEKANAAEESFQASQAKLAEAEDALSLRLETEIPQTEELIRHAAELLESRQDYLENSLYCVIDPFHCGVSRLTVRIDAADGGTQGASLAVSSLSSRLSSDSSELFSAMQTILKTDAEPAYIRELISVSNISDTIIGITAFHTDPQLAEQLCEAVYADLERSLKRDSRFTAEIVDSFCGYEVNWDMRDRQLLNRADLVSSEQTLAAAREELVVLKDGIPTLTKAVDDANTALKNAQNVLQKAERKTQNSLATPKNIIKNTLFCLVAMFFAGLLLSCVAVIFLRLSSGKLLSRSAILTGCDYPLLGVLPNEKPVLFEKAIRKLEGLGGADYQSAANTLAQTLLSLVGDRRVCFVSSLGKDAAETLVSLTDGRIKACGDIVNDPDAIKALSSFDGIVLAEKTDLSALDMIDAEIQRAKALGKEILGIALI